MVTSMIALPSILKLVFASRIMHLFNFTVYIRLFKSIRTMTYRTTMARSIEQVHRLNFLVSENCTVAIVRQYYGELHERCRRRAEVIRTATAGAATSVGRGQSLVGKGRGKIDYPVPHPIRGSRHQVIVCVFRNVYLSPRVETKVPVPRFLVQSHSHRIMNSTALTLAL